MATPLSKRFPRELRRNLSKYLGIFILLTLSIAIVSGFLVAASSIERINDAMRETYQIEDARFTVNDALTDEQAAVARRKGLTLNENFSRDVSLKPADDGAASTARVHVNRSDFDLPALTEGAFPQTASEIAINRNYATNNNLAVGDSIELDGMAYTVSGICTLPDYTAQFKNNNDFVMNNLSFCTALLTDQGFDRLSDTPISYTYSVRFDRTMGLAQRTDAENDLVSALQDARAEVTDLVDADSNSGITYAGKDIGSDQTLWEVLMGLIIVIMAFIFVVLTGATIEEESAIIGTLLASGYRKGELIRHYLFLPAAIGVTGAALGNILGYTLMIDPMKDLYYNSYSFPPYTTSFSLSAFVITTIIPVVLLVGITWIGLARKLRCSPLQFLRHETRRASKRHGLRLPRSWGYVTRFRVRIFVRNLSQFVTLFAGIMFASLLLLYGMAILPTMQKYTSSLAQTLPAQHVYTLKAPLDLEGTQEQRDAYAAAYALQDAGLTDEQDIADALTGTNATDLDTAEIMDLASKASTIDADATPVDTHDNGAATIEQAEKICMGQLQVAHKWGDESETVTVYAIPEDSRYLSDIDVTDGKVVAGRGLQHKCLCDPASTRSFYDKFNDESHELTISGVYGGASNTNLYMSVETFNRLFDNDAGYFNGYLSDEPLALDAKYLASEITPADMEEAGAQMENSMGDMMYMIEAMAVIVFFIVMYLLTKTVIERNARQISYLKVFGYRDKEISKIYVRTITLAVAVSLLVSVPVIYWALSLLFEAMFMGFSGNFVLDVPWYCLVIEVLAGFLTYSVVAALHMRRIKNVSLSLAMKVQE